MSRATIPLLSLLVLTTAAGLASASSKPTRMQMFYARREVELEAQLAKMKLSYTDSHPRIINLQAEIEQCKRRTTPIALSNARRGKQPGIQTLEQELAIKQEELYQKRLSYTDANPQVKAAQQIVEDLVREIALRKQK